VTAFSIRAVIVYLLTPAPISIADRLRLLRDLFSRLERVLIRFSSKSSNEHQAVSL
jgi:hypothetical protein